jgi:REP element-mobilizing transposase RayT
MPEREPHLRIHYNRLPHWRLDGQTYFVTWRLRKDLPGLQDAERGIVAEALKRFHRQRYRLMAYVVMDDHVHAVLQPAVGEELSRIALSLKSFTARTINHLRARQGPLWQKDSFDRIIRDEDELKEKMQYILNNPLKRWPEVVEYRWAEWLVDE